MSQNNLRQKLKSFVGRAREIADIRVRLQDEHCRLLTLVGPGGIGKTELAVQVVAQCVDQFTDGVYFVPLQSLNDPEFIVSAIADAVNFQFVFGSGHPKQQLINYLRKRDALLVLDNFEHLLDSAQLLSDILQSTSHLYILVTSRERLDLVEEWVLDVRELNYPTDTGESDIETYDAIELFLQRVRQIHGAIELTTSQKASVIRICQLVGGIPLGIEMAATRVRSLSLEDIATEIEQSLDVLQTSARNVEPRHRNIRATIDPMYDQLTDEQQLTFEQLSQFRGGFTRDAAEHVTGTSIQTLAVLVEHSLVRMDNNGRYDLNELLRQYAEERLSDHSDEMEQTRARHSQYFLDFLAQHRMQISGSEQQQVLNQIQCEIDNIRAAWKWAVDRQYAEKIGEVCHVLWLYYDIRGGFWEGEQAFRLAAEALGLHKTQAGKSLNLGKVMARYGAHCQSINLHENGRQLLEESLIVLHRFSAREDIAFVLLRLSDTINYFDNDPETAQTYVDKSWAIYRDLDVLWGMGYCRRALAKSALYRGDFEAAWHWSEECLELYKPLTKSYERSLALGIASLSALELKQYEVAHHLTEELLPLMHEIGTPWNIANALLIKGATVCRLTDYAKARDYLSKGLIQAYDVGFLPIIMFGLVQTAVWLVATGDKVKGLEITSFVAESPVPPLTGKSPVNDVISQLRQDLSIEEFNAAVKRGRLFNLETVRVSCLNGLQTNIVGSSLSPQPSKIALTERELEVLALVAEGLNSPEVAQRLHLSVHTIRWYLKRIYTKLGVHNRTQALSCAFDLNLLP